MPEPAPKRRPVSVESPGNDGFRYEPVPTPQDATEPATTEDRYWRDQAQQARAERDSLALGVLRLADAWVEEFGETGIRPEVCAATIRSAVETMGWR